MGSLHSKTGTPKHRHSNSRSNNHRKPYNRLNMFKVRSQWASNRIKECQT